MADGVHASSPGEFPRREGMQTPDEVAAMLRLKVAWVENPADRQGAGVQPYDGSALCRRSRRRLGCLSGPRATAGVGRS